MQRNPGHGRELLMTLQKAEPSLIVIAGVVLAVVIVASRRLDMQRITNIIERFFRSRSRRRCEDPGLERQVRVAVESAARFVPGSACAARALAMVALLSWKGYSCELRVGVRRTPQGRLSAHAWVVNSSDQVISEPGEQVCEFLRIHLRCSFPS